MGGRAYVAVTAGSGGYGGSVVPVPTFDLNVVHGFTDALDFELRLSSLGLINLLDLGLRGRLGDAAFSVAGRLDATVLALTAFSAGNVAIFGVTPGIAVSFGDRRSQFTLGSDVVLAFAAAANDGEGSFGGATSHPVGFIRPSATYEFGVGKKNTMYLQAGAYVTAFTGDPSANGFVVPVFAIGASW
jgi:hypothetical protein